MKQVFFKGGRPFTADVPPPLPEPGRIVVVVRYSAVSPGTELATLDRSGRSSVSRVVEKGKRVGRMLELLKKRDPRDIQMRMVRLLSRRHAWIAPGYSGSGTVLSVGDGVRTFSPGDRVAVAGAGYAVHAEQVSVPEQMATLVPRGLELAPASTVALGAIALQSVRRAESRVGETVFVLGLGFIGQLTARILLASGCRVLGWDPRPERCSMAESSGALVVDASSVHDIPRAVLAETQGIGADQAILAASRAPGALDLAARVTRKNGVLVVLGDSPIQLDRGVAYERELTIRVSTSYGPGRYDPRYEEEGHDYPSAYVRWTENRNMSAYLGLLATGKVDLAGLIDEIVTAEDAAAAYARLRQGQVVSPGLIFKFAGAPGGVEGEEPPAAHDESSVRPRGAPMSKPVRIGFLGTGGYATDTVLPLLSKMGDDIKLDLLVGSQPARREPLARRYGFARTSSSYEEGATDDGCDLICILTRHHRHATLAEKALTTGHAVYCEKPLGLTERELDGIEAALAKSGAFLAVGFNRRFAPASLRAKEELNRRTGPLHLVYRVQAGRLPDDHWLHGPQGGGRLIGECIHMLDLTRFLVGEPLQKAWCLPGGAGGVDDPAADNFHIGLRYRDGSTAAILYTDRGSPHCSKERVELHWDGRTLEIDDFKDLVEAGRSQAIWKSSVPDKGQSAFWQTCLRALLAGGSTPTPIHEVLESSRAAILLDKVRRGRETLSIRLDN